MPSLQWSSKQEPRRQQAKLSLDSLVYPQGNGYLDTLGNADNRTNHSLIFGDNLAVLWAMLPEWEGGVDLIYVDPPFFSNRHYPARVGRGEDSRKPKEWKLADGYPDHWSSLEEYLDMLYPRLVLMHRLLAPTGTLYLHLDWHANAYARVLLDEIFGVQKLLNEIIWVYHGPSPIRRAYNRKHDTILAYTRGEDYTFNVDAVRQPYDPVTVKTFESSPKAGFGKVPNLERGKVPEDWWYFPVVARLHSERTGYPTQKPEALIERIILASSNPGDTVADFFCGSGTAAVVAERLGRRAIANDAAWRAIHTTRSRLVSHSAEPFSIQILESQSLPSSEVRKGPIAVRVEDSVLLSDNLVDDTDYWEVDPFWDGKVFRSAMQAARPRSGAAIQRKMSLPILSDKRPVCVRLVTIDGDFFEEIINR
jgi:DNA modification methylase